ncbi:hypothetical protein EVG20_g9648 [Dentipellis fragilis]|uniref:Uncharacterized protein n=1 Tax=Dentipellis fragilis TaxID=205917 RepID=A0A4Y9XXS9_9AGAM|nr:hypothetical protein EVG20_g9648 [Dentipellis fragilis]
MGAYYWQAPKGTYICQSFSTTRCLCPSSACIGWARDGGIALWIVGGLFPFVNLVLQLVQTIYSPLIATVIPDATSPTSSGRPIVTESNIPLTSLPPALTMSRSSGMDIFGLVSGIISIMALLVHAIRIHLPSAKMEELDGLLIETENLFHDAQEQGLLKDSEFVQQTKQSLANFQNNALSIRSQVHSATSLFAQFLEMFKGLSMKISTILKQVKTVRAKISTTSAREKERLQEMDSRALLNVETTAGNEGAHADVDSDPSVLDTLPLHNLCLDRTETAGSSDSATVKVGNDTYVKAETISPINTNQETSPLPTE